MTKDEAIRRAVQYAKANSLQVGPILDARYFDIKDLDEKENPCPPDLIETLHSVKQGFRNHWVVAFKIVDLPGRVSCPESKLVCVFDTGEVSVFSSP